MKNYFIFIPIILCACAPQQRNGAVVQTNAAATTNAPRAAQPSVLTRENNIAVPQVLQRQTQTVAPESSDPGYVVDPANTNIHILPNGARIYCDPVTGTCRRLQPGENP